MPSKILLKLFTSSPPLAFPPHISSNKSTSPIPFLSTMATKHQSPLMRLPPELRNLISTALFSANETTLENVKWDLTRAKHRVPLPGIVLACQQTYQESIGLYYLTITFVSSDSIEIISWYNGLPKKYARLVRNMRYDVVAQFKGRSSRWQSQPKSAVFAQNMINNIGNQLGARAIGAFGAEALEASIRMKRDEILWTSTPVKTYNPSVPLTVGRPSGEVHRRYWTDESSGPHFRT